MTNNKKRFGNIGILILIKMRLMEGLGDNNNDVCYNFVNPYTNS